MAAGKLTLTSLPRETVLEVGGDIEVPEGVTRYRLPDTGTFTFNLRHEHSQLLLYATIRASNAEAPNLRTSIVHYASRTQAETIVRTLSCDTAQPRYSGMIRIMPGAKGCESYLSHHSLLLDSSARSWSVPSLEIGNNEVKCSHAATLRTLTDSDLFYLRSRGLSKVEARRLLVDAFLGA